MKSLVLNNNLDAGFFSSLPWQGFEYQLCFEIHDQGDHFHYI